MLIWLNGRLVDESRAMVSVWDRGFLFGDGVYEVVRYFRADRTRAGVRRVGVGVGGHVARLARSLSLARIAGFDAGELPEIARATLDANDLDDATLYVQVTRGTGSGRAHVPMAELTPTVMASAMPAEPLDAMTAPQVVRAITLEDPRWRLCQIKTTSLMGNIVALLDADARGATEAILHRGGLVGEGAYTNVFAVVDGTLVTAPVDADPPILHGVTRDDVLAIAARERIPVEVRPLRASELPAADEILITSTRRLVSSVGELDGGPVGDGRAGPIARRIFDAMRDAIARLCRGPAAVTA